MTPKERAKELVDKYRFGKPISFIDKESNEIEFAKECALIAVDELIKNSVYSKWRYMAFGTGDDANLIYFKEHWQEVKQEIEKL